LNPGRLYILILLLCTDNALQGQFRLTPNLGQWDAPFLFKADLRGAKLFVSEGELTYLFYDAAKIHSLQHTPVERDSLPVHVIRIRFSGASPEARYTGENAFGDYANYFLGSKPERWKSRVSSYRKLYVHNVYPDIDFELFESEGRLKYNFIVRPGGDPAQIKLTYTGADSIHTEGAGLKVYYRFGSITESAPLVYESAADNQKRILKSAFRLEGNELGFKIGSKRHAGKTMVIDPVFVFSTYSGSLADNFGYTATFDTAGHGYAGGTVFDIGFPTTSGAYQVSFSGGNTELSGIGYVARDCGIIKYSEDGSTLLYTTYLGGTASNEQPHSMIVDSRNNLLVMGTTKSSDFPIGIAPAFDPTHNGLSDIFVVRFSEDGSDLISGTFVGGSGFDGLNGDRPSGATSPLLYNYADDFRGEITIDENDNVYVASSTSSSDFPTVNGFDKGYNGKQDGCLFKLSADLSEMVFGTYIGGTGDDAAYGLDLGTRNDLYVTGGTNSTSFANTGWSGGLKLSNNGGRADGFLFRFDLNGQNLLAYTYIGTSAYDQCYFVKTDKYGKPFIYGQSEGVHSASAGVYANKDAKMFLKKLDFNLSSVELETTFGALNKSRPDISPTALLVDECERIFISGWGAINFTPEFSGGGTFNMPLTPDAHQKQTDGYDFYLAVFSKNFTELQYATYFGGRSNSSVDVHEHVDGGTSRFDKKGIIYQSVCAGCGGQSLFPTTPGAWSNTNNSVNCNNALFKFDFENLNRKPLARDSFYTLLANDTLDFEIVVSDPDRSDSLRIVLSGDMFNDPAFPKPLPEIVSYTRLSGVNAIKARIRWYPNCGHTGLDTLNLYVKVYDQGCPTQDSNQALVRIVVQDPPLTVTPETLCMFFKEDGSLNISWKAFQKNKFFNYVLLNRENPNGSVRVLDTIFSNSSGAFRDNPPMDPRVQNFQYYMVGYNVCNKPFDAGVRINTLREFNVPIDSTYMRFATVADNKNVHINWFTSKEEDFGSYDVYRADNIEGVSYGYRKIKTISNLTDTDFIDEQVDVSQKSYCYRIGVNDKCGHVSKPSNEACNIVLKGVPGHLYFDLDWLPYRQWEGGVRNYELRRRVDTGSLRKIADNGLLRVLHDDELDLWWGAYYYVVQAYEGFSDSGTGFNAVSLSNEIRLIQPPMVFVPNAFSPNGDNYNDVWGVSHAFVKDFRMMVFNRWGEKVWDNDFKGTQWDGSTRGRMAMNDVFVWIVTYRGWDNRFYTQKGTVTVMP